MTPVHYLGNCMLHHVLVLNKELVSLLKCFLFLLLMLVEINLGELLLGCILLLLPHLILLLSSQLLLHLLISLQLDWINWWDPRLGKATCRSNARL